MRRPALPALPLRTQLVGVLVLLIAGALLVSGLVTSSVLQRRLVQRVDAQLVAAAEPLARDAASGDVDDWRGGRRDLLPSTFVVQFDLPDTASQQVYGGQLDERDVPALPSLTPEEALATRGRPSTVDGPGQDWRVVSFLAGPDATVSVALPLGDVERTVGQVRLLSVLVGLLVVAGGAALGWAAVRRSLRPLGEVETTAAAIAAGDLSRRVPDAPPDTEVGRLTAALNGMLAQLETAFRAREASNERMRRFVADASHELRTPLAAVRGFAELHRQGAVRDPEGVARAFRRIEDEARRMGGLVEDLLALARLDEQRPMRREEVDLLVLAGDAVADARALAPDRAVRLAGVDGPPAPTPVLGDEDRLRQVLANLVANAVRHTPAGTPVEVAVGTATGANGLPAALVEVRDHGAGVAPQDRERVFERFFRTDASRQRGAGGGSGLGLSIVAAVAAAHSGSVDVVETAGGGATFRLALPPLASGERDDEPDDERDDEVDLDEEPAVAAGSQATPSRGSGR